MTPVAAAAFTLIAGMPVQRWLLGVGGALIALTALLLPQARIVWLIVAWPAPLALLATIFCMGMLFHDLSAPRTTVLVPHYRRHLLLGVALSVVLVTALVVAVLELTPRWDEVGVGALAAYVALTLTAFTLLSCLVSAPGAMTIAMLSLPIWYGAAAINDALPVAARSALPFAAGLVTLAAWAAFAKWYLRSEPMPPFRIPFGRVAQGWRSARERRLAANGALPEHAYDERAAERREGRYTLIVEGWPRGASSWLLLYLVAAAGSGVLVGGFLWLSERDNGTNLLAQLVIQQALIVALQIRGRINHFTRRLWLLGGSRAALFRVTEAVVWRNFVGLWVVCITVMCVAMAWQGSLSWTLAALAPLLLFGNSLISLYLVLTPGHAMKAPAAIVLVISSVVVSLCLASLSERTNVMVAVIALQLVAALTLRAATQRAWCTIDWVGVRVKRTTALRSMQARRQGPSDRAARMWERTK